MVDFPAPFGSEEPVHLTAVDLEVEPVERGEVAEALDQAGGTDHGLALRHRAVLPGLVSVVGIDIASVLSFLVVGPWRPEVGLVVVGTSFSRARPSAPSR